ncbi:MAG: endonuclease [Breznakibacter sp.]|nr:endonuclease [Breznakibacter sp.]
MNGWKKNRRQQEGLYWIGLLLMLLVPHRAVAGGDTLLVMFYNVENLFDVHNDSLTRDEDFLPDGSYRWTYSRYKQKSTNIARVILTANQWNPPVLVGLCEVENAFVIKQLLYGSGLGNVGYDYIHFDSPDFRGIDVALLYNRYLIKILEKRAVSLSNPKLDLVTRDALYAKVIYAGDDTLHIVVNHWPSKRGGEKASEEKRGYAAAMVRALCDSIRSHQAGAHIVLMGDFNDEASSYAIHEVLGAKAPSDATSLLINLSLLNKNLGSHKFQGSWSCIDHIIVSRSLWSEGHPPIFKLVDLPFLLEEDKIFSGVKPFRTYSGPRYLGGYSDHLPVMAYILLP